MSSLYLFNNLSRKKEAFIPQDENRVTMYVCGPTVYSHPHIGNARPAVVFDVLFRVLQHDFNNVVYARNITDVEDKIIKAAQDANVSMKTITDKYTKIYHDDLSTLGVLPPTIEPHATDHIEEMITMISTLIEKGFAYEADGHVLFDVAKYEDYGQLSGRKLDEMLAGARVDIGEYKQNSADFVLWKPSYGETPGWPSPWISKEAETGVSNNGLGRPGWHIECSSMAKKHLGKTIDIHGGGHDLIFPHHENEIAQSTCAHDGALFSRFWLHNGFINMGTEKMSKSLGNIMLVKDLLAEHQGETIRIALLSTHYRKPIEWNDATTEQAKNKLDRLYRALAQGSAEESAQNVQSSNTINPSAKVLNALHDDLNTPLAIDALLQQANEINKAEGATQSQLIAQLRVDAQLLGLLSQDPNAWLKGNAIDEDLTAWVEAQLQLRVKARQEKDFAAADAIRDALAAKNIEIEDGANGVTWSVKS